MQKRRAAKRASSHTRRRGGKVLLLEEERLNEGAGVVVLRLRDGKYRTKNFACCGLVCGLRSKLPRSIGELPSSVWRGSSWKTCPSCQGPCGKLQHRHNTWLARDMLTVAPNEPCGGSFPSAQRSSSRKSVTQAIANLFYHDGRRDRWCMGSGRNAAGPYSRLQGVQVGPEEALECASAGQLGLGACTCKILPTKTTYSSFGFIAAAEESKMALDINLPERECCGTQVYEHRSHWCDRSGRSQ